MRHPIARLVLALLVLGVAATASAQVAVESGTVVRVDPQSSVVMLDDGRMFRVTPNTVVLIDNRPTPFPALRPGERVVIQSAEPVVYRDGRYVPLSAPVVTQAPPQVMTQAPPQVMTQAPPPVVVQAPGATAVPAGVKQTIYGTVDDVDSDGTVEIKTERDEFEVRISQETASRLKRGDTVIIDMTFTAPGAPSAFPR
jgi:hypothetical protein